MMRAVAEKLTGIELGREAIDMTARVASRATMGKLCMWEHSPLRTQIYKVVLTDIPVFVMGHLCRHKIGVEWFVMSKRSDRGGLGDERETRASLTNLMFIANAESLLTMARRRLCFQASPETRDTMVSIKEAIRIVDPDLAHWMVPHCVYRGGICPEPRPCGNYLVSRPRSEDDEVSMRMPGRW